MGNITLKNVSKSFGATSIIPGLDLVIENGEFVVFVGPSGCGKSTLLRLIAGLEDTSGGSINIDGRDVTGEAPAKRKLAMVFQSYALYPHMTVAKNIGFPLKMAGEDKATIDRKVADAARVLNLTNYLERRPASCPAASASASRSAAPSFASRRPSCSTSRCRTSTPRFAARCGWRSASCTSS
jgi:multiple sugar transport system ATP-binding protein